MGTKRLKSIVVGLVSCCCLIKTSGLMADSQFSLMPGILYFDYEETAEDGSFLDAETDPLAGLSLKIENKYVSGIRSVIHGGIYSGNVEYDGHAYPSGEPVTTYTRTRIFHLGASVKFPLQYSPLATYFNVGYQLRRWERDIRPTVDPVIGQVAGLYEVYEWGEYAMGFEIYIGDSHKNQWILYAGAFQTIDPQIEIDLSANGNGKPRLYMGSDTGLQLSAQWMGARKSLSRTGVRLSYKFWRFGQSNSETLPNNDVVTEPRSRTHILQLEFVLAMDI